MRFASEAHFGVPRLHSAEARGLKEKVAGGQELLATKATGESVQGDELADQFLVFQWADEASGHKLLTPERVQPSLTGTTGPDVVVSIEMISFHIGANENIDGDTRAVMRLDVGKDDNSVSHLEDITYTILSGFNLFNEDKKRVAAARTESKVRRSPVKATH